MRSKLDHPVLLAALGAAGLLIGAFGKDGDAPPPPPKASSPTRLPPRGWWDVVKAVGARISSDRVMTEAAGVTFYTLLAIFPALAALISLYGLVADPATVSDHLASLQGIMPSGGMDIVKEEVTSLTSGEHKALGLGVLFGLATSLWSANQGTKALFEALNVVNQAKEARGFLRLTLVTLAFTLGALAFLVFAMAAVVLVPVVLNFLGLGGVAGALLDYARWPLLLVVVALFLAVIYRFGPSGNHAAWRLLSWGSGFAAVSWLAGSAGFSWYVANFGSYNKTYGSLGAVVGFMTWLWISIIIILIGGELNAELERKTGAAPAPRKSHDRARKAATA